MGKYTELSDFIVDKIGGKGNVDSVYHCMTRLRFELKDKSIADTKALEANDGIVTVMESGNQYMVVIGSHVDEVFEDMNNQYHFSDTGNKEKSNKKKEGNIISRLFTVMSSIFTPVIPAIAGAGMLKALLVILTTFNLMSDESSTYFILSAAGNSVFYFLPLFLAISSAKTFGANIYVSLAILGALMEPNFTDLFTDNGEVVSFLGIPVVLMSYESTIIPSILAIWLYSYIEPILKKITPKSIEMFLVPLLGLLIMVPLASIAIGPIGVYLAEWIGAGIDFLSVKNGMITGALIGGGWTFLVMFGVHWGVVPAMLANLSSKGYDTIRPMMASATFAQGGVALGVFLKAKSKKLKSYALSVMFPVIFAGVTEPVVYGLSVKYKRPMIAAVIGGAVGGGFAGAFGTQVMTYVFPSLLTIPAFFTDTISFYLISIIISFFLTAVLTYLLGFQEDADPDEQGEITTSSNDVSEEDTQDGGQAITIHSPLQGIIIKQNEIEDAAFSTGAMGKGVGVLPTEGKIYAPFDGKVTALFPTGHAIGLTSNDKTAELLIHVGLDTVKLEGKYFKTHVSQNDEVTKGDVLIEFDLEAVKKEGFDVTTPVVVTNAGDDKNMDVMEREVTNGEELFTLENAESITNQ